MQDPEFPISVKYRDDFGLFYAQIAVWSMCIIIPGDPLTNADLTQEYVYGQKYGIGLVLSGGQSLGAYTMP